MTKEEIYIAALDNCSKKENCFNCPYLGINCWQKLRKDIKKNINPDNFIAAGLIKKGYVKSDYYPMCAAINYKDVYLKPFEDYTQEVEWFGDIYFVIPQKEISYDVYDENSNIIYSASTIEEAKEYVNNLTIKKTEKEKI